MASSEMTTKDSASDHLPDCLSYDSKTGIYVCTKCKQGFENVNAVRMHLRKKHDENASLSACLLAKLIPEVEKFDEEARNTYRGAPKSLNKHGETLQLLPFLELYMGKQCPECLFCHVNDLSMKYHLQRDHNVPVEESVSRTNSLSEIPLQTLFLGNRCEFFPVTTDDSQFQGLCSSTAVEKPG